MTRSQIQENLGQENEPVDVDIQGIPPDGLRVQTIATWDDGVNQLRVVFDGDGQAAAITIGQSGKAPMLLRVLDAMGW
jgi:hypothetical protein